MSNIELYHDVSRRNNAFANNVLGSRVDAIFQTIVDQRVDNPDLTVPAVFEDYLQTSKTFGDIDKDHLDFYTLVCLAFTRDRRVPKEFKADAFELAASMMWETAFIETVESHNAPATVDDRISLIDAGSSFLQHASTLTQNSDMERTQRILVRNLFSQAMRDIVAGEVTQATRDELLLSLRDARSQLKFITNSAERNGLLGELLTLEKFWLAYGGKGDKIAIPATVRGGDGRFKPDETHDIDILRQRRDDSWVVLTPVEVKNRRITDKIRRRYTKSHLASVAVDGSIALSGDHREIAI